MVAGFQVLWESRGLLAFESSLSSLASNSVLAFRIPGRHTRLFSIYDLTSIILESVSYWMRILSHFIFHSQLVCGLRAYLGDVLSVWTTALAL